MYEVNKERVNELLTGLAKFTASEEGVTRLAYIRFPPVIQKQKIFLILLNTMFKAGAGLGP